MLGAFRSTRDEHYIHLGMVGCPRSHCDVEIDLCSGCEVMQEISTTGRLRFVRCKPRESLVEFERQRIERHSQLFPRIWFPSI